MNIFERYGLPFHNRKPRFQVGEIVTWKDGYHGRREGKVTGIQLRHFFGIVYAINYYILRKNEYRYHLDPDEPEYDSAVNIGELKLLIKSQGYRPKKAKTPKMPKKKINLNPYRNKNVGDYQETLRW